MKAIGSSLKIRVAQLDWALLSNESKTNDLSWIDGTIKKSHRPFISQNDKYSHRPYGYFLPTAMVDAAIVAQSYQEPTVLEGLLLINAKVEWLIETRKYLWTPMSPVPKLLTVLADAFGIGPELHNNKPDVLSRLAAVLPKWYPHRGGVDRARFLIEKTIGTPLKIKTEDKNETKLPLIDEAFTCRSVDWWRQRSRAGSQPTQIRIESGIVLFQPDAGESYPALKEDTVVEWCIGDNFPIELTRLLPPWGSVRLIVK